jgi:hypothetical protein
MTMVAPVGNDATLRWKQRPWGVGDTGNSGGGESSGTTMTATTGDKDYNAGHCIVNNDGYWHNTDNHGDGCNC